MLIRVMEAARKRMKHPPTDLVRGVLAVSELAAVYTSGKPAKVQSIADDETRYVDGAPFR